MDIYKKAIVNVFTMLYGKIENLNEETENLVELETELAKIMRKYISLVFLKKKNKMVF